MVNLDEGFSNYFSKAPLKEFQKRYVPLKQDSISCFQKTLKSKKNIEKKLDFDKI